MGRAFSVLPLGRMPPQDSGHFESAPELQRALGEGSVVAGRFRIERLVARGGMATVFLASQLGLHRQVALKLVHPAEEEIEEKEAFQERFRLEAKTLASLNHPHIVTVYDYGETDEGDCFIAMEYVEGPRFARLLKKGPLEPTRAVDLVIQVCRALRYAHSKGVVHRDVKLSNVLIGKDEHGDEHVKVVDFGLVKITGNEQKLTSHGLVLGSPHFMAPEQVRGAELDQRADLYSVGVLLYCSLTGRYPFHGTSRTATMTAHLTREVPPWSEQVPDRTFPQGLEAVVRKALSREREDRHPDMDALISDLLPFASAPSDLPSVGSATPGTLVGPPVRGPGSPGGPSTGRLIAVGVVAFLLGLALVGGIWGAVAEPEPVTVQVDLPRALPAPPPPPADAPEVADEETPAAVAAPEPTRAAPSTRSSSSRAATPRSSARRTTPEPEPPSADPEPAPTGEPTGRAVAETPAEPQEEGVEPTDPDATETPAVGSDIADPWQGGEAPPSEAPEDDKEEENAAWQQPGSDLRDPWAD